MNVSSVTLDPSDVATVSFSAVAWLAEEGTTLSSFVLTPSATVTVQTSSSGSGIVTARITATASGTLACKFTFADSQVRERTMTIVVTNL